MTDQEQARPRGSSDPTESSDVAAVRQAIATQLDSHPEWLLPGHQMELARWMNELLDEGSSEVIEDPDEFRRDWPSQLASTPVSGPEALLGLEGYPPFDVGVVRAPELVGNMLVFYVQRYSNLLPLKASVSLTPPYLPALYEGLPHLAGNP